MVYTLCFPKNVSKHCLKRIGTERSHFGLLCAFVKLSGEIILKLKQRLMCS